SYNSQSLFCFLTFLHAFCIYCIDSASTLISTLSLHDALPICLVLRNNAGDDLTVTEDGSFTFPTRLAPGAAYDVTVKAQPKSPRSEEHTSELQSRENLVCRLLLEKNKIDKFLHDFEIQ